MADVEAREAPGTALERLIKERGLKKGYVGEQVLRLNDPASMTRRLSGEIALKPLEVKALAEFFGVPESTFEAAS